MTLFSALLPVFLIILCGTFIKRLFLQEECFWRGCEQLVYYLLFPALLLSKLSEVQLAWSSLQTTLLILLGASGIVGLLLFFVARLVGMKGATFSSVFQGGIRFNAYIFLATSIQLFGDDGVTIVALLAGCMIVFANLVCVSVLSICNSQKTSIAAIIRALLCNPLLLSSACGASLSFFEIELPSLLHTTLAYISSATMPLSLLAVGAGLTFTIGAHRWLAVWLATAAKLFLLPVFTLVLLLLCEVSGIMRDIALLYAAMPCASSAYILARHMGGDTQVMASIITVTTLVSSVTIPVVLLLSLELF